MTIERLEELKEWFHDIAGRLVSAFHAENCYLIDYLIDDEIDRLEKGDAPVDIPDKLPCEWCDGKEKDICRTGNPSAYLEEDSGDWYLTFVLSDYHSMLDDSVEINYCPNCGRKLK